MSKRRTNLTLASSNDVHSQSLWNSRQILIFLFILLIHLAAQCDSFAFSMVRGKNIISSRPSWGLFQTATAENSNSDYTEEDSSVFSKARHSHNESSLLQDNTGHINRELAERIWAWEEEIRQHAQLPKLDYSVRSGLRLVDELVQGVLSASGTSKQQSTKSQERHRSDLIQEGLSALLSAMSQYRQQQRHEQEGFEDYARSVIRQQLQLSLRNENKADRPALIPMAVRTVLRQAKQVAQRQTQQRENATWETVAREMQLSPTQLKTYVRMAAAARRSGSPSLSVESTVEILHPSTLEEPAYRDQDEFELWEGLLLDTGTAVDKDQVIGEFLDETLENEGDDQAWVHEERIAGPLTDLIPDTSEPAPDDGLLQELIRKDLGSFLSSALTNREEQVVRLLFGLQDADDESNTKGPQTMKMTAQTLGIEASEVSKMLPAALQKLRTSYWARFRENDFDDDLVAADDEDSEGTDDAE